RVRRAAGLGRAPPRSGAALRSAAVLFLGRGGAALHSVAVPVPRRGGATPPVPGVAVLLQASPGTGRRRRRRGTAGWAGSQAALPRSAGSARPCSVRTPRSAESVPRCSVRTPP